VGTLPPIENRPSPARSRGRSAPGAPGHASPRLNNLPSLPERRSAAVKTPFRRPDSGAGGGPLGPSEALRQDLERRLAGPAGRGGGRPTADAAPAARATAAAAARSTACPRGVIGRSSSRARALEVAEPLLEQVALHGEPGLEERPLELLRRAPAAVPTRRRRRRRRAPRRPAAPWARPAPRWAAPAEQGEQPLVGGVRGTAPSRTPGARPPRRRPTARRAAAGRPGEVVRLGQLGRGRPARRPGPRRPEQQEQPAGRHRRGPSQQAQGHLPPERRRERARGDGEGRRAAGQPGRLRPCGSWPRGGPGPWPRPPPRRAPRRRLRCRRSRPRAPRRTGSSRCASGTAPARRGPSAAAGPPGAASAPIGAGLDEDVAELPAVGEGVLTLERRGERLRRDEAEADQDAPEGLPDRARGGVHDASQPHHDQPVRVPSAERHLPGAVVQRQEVEQLRELDLLEAAGEAHGPRGPRGRARSGVPGARPRIRRTASSASGQLARRRARVSAGSADRAAGPIAPSAFTAAWRTPGSRSPSAFGRAPTAGLGGGAHALERHGRGHAQGGVRRGERLGELGRRRPRARPCPRGCWRRRPLGRRARGRSISARPGTAGSPSVMSWRRARPLFSGPGRAAPPPAGGRAAASAFRQPGRIAATRTTTTALRMASTPHGSLAGLAGVRGVEPPNSRKEAVRPWACPLRNVPGLRLRLRTPRC
jgi:hypothetical protein